jgi:hypothetical protein
MNDKFSPPVELWSAQQCANVLGYRNVSAWKYAAQKAKLQPWTYHGTAAMWRAQDVRDAVKSWLV